MGATHAASGLVQVAARDAAERPGPEEHREMLANLAIR
jgi:hypothetical protein